MSIGERRHTLSLNGNMVLCGAWRPNDIFSDHYRGPLFQAGIQLICLREMVPLTLEAMLRAVAHVHWSEGSATGYAVLLLALFAALP